MRASVAARARGLMVDAKLHQVWCRVRGPFHMPQRICLHVASWEAYDFGLAGCRLCGAQHRCNAGDCPSEKTHEGQEICTITGLWLSMLNLSNIEAVESAGVFVTKDGLASACKDHRAGATHQHLEEDVYRVVHLLLCSDAWATCREGEVSRYSERCAAVMIRQLKNFKHKDKKHLPILPDLIARYYQEIGSAPPVVGDVPAVQRDAMCAMCVRIIHQHVRVLAALQPGLVQQQRVQSVVVGLLYLLRVGVTCKGMSVLPKVPHLGHMLPSENNLYEHFKIRSKCITDCENLVKHILRTNPSHMLRARAAGGY